MLFSKLKSNLNLWSTSSKYGCSKSSSAEVLHQSLSLSELPFIWLQDEQDGIRKKYSENYLKYLLKILHKNEPSEAEKYRMLFNVEKNEEDYHKRPFSKFKNDIIEKLLKIDDNKLNP